MVEVEVIKLKRAEGWSIRKIARQLGYSRQTVRKALEAPAEVPRYSLKEPRPQPVMGPYLSAVEAILAADEDAPPKQRHTARRIYHRLVEEHGFTGSPGDGEAGGPASAPQEGRDVRALRSPTGPDSPGRLRQGQSHA